MAVKERRRGGAVSVTDLQAKGLLAARLNMPDRELVSLMVESHLANAPETGMVMALWLNARSDPWQEGVKLLEIGEGVPKDPEPEFRATEFGSRHGWPRVCLSLAHPDELETEKGRAYSEALRQKLARKDAEIVFANAEAVCRQPVLGTFVSAANRG
jgi:hypothetical protein